MASGNTRILGMVTAVTQMGTGIITSGSSTSHGFARKMATSATAAKRTIQIAQ